VSLLVIVYLTLPDTSYI